MYSEEQKGNVKHFLREGEKIWRCGTCGRVFIGVGKPKLCPVCREKEGFHLLEPEKY